MDIEHAHSASLDQNYYVMSIDLDCIPTTSSVSENATDSHFIQTYDVEDGLLSIGFPYSMSIDYEDDDYLSIRFS